MNVEFFKNLPDFQPSPSLVRLIEAKIDNADKTNYLRLLFYSLALNMLCLFVLNTLAIKTTRHFENNINLKEVVIAKNQEVSNLSAINLLTGEKYEKLTIYRSAEDRVVKLPPGYYLAIGNLDNEAYATNLFVSNY